MKKVWFIKIAFFALLAVAALGAVVMWLWNWLIPELFNGPVISYVQALGLMLLSRILFRGFFGPKNKCGHGGPWMNMKGKFENMSPEEREKMRDLWKKRCGSYRDCSDTPDASEEKK
jgi:ABC-type multidrug transport system fused ATPase/permease subunit